MNRASSATGWVRNPDGTLGYTWNPITGCLNGCEYCYARKLANGRLRSRYLANTNIAPYDSEEAYMRYKTDPFYPRFWEDRLSDFDNLFAIDEPNYLRKLPKKPRGIFVCDMSDLFGIGIPEEWTRKVLNVIEQSDMHRFYLLTKQPQNLIKFSPFPDNCWVGVTTTGENMFDDALECLQKVKASIKYISIEPYLERIYPESVGTLLKWAGIGQVIIGAQTKPYKPPEISWVEEIVRACDKAGVKVFLKDNLKPLLDKVSDGIFFAASIMVAGSQVIEYSPQIPRLRQELPQ